ncbi:MAG: ATP-binding protein [Thermoleophilaceae bacterium]
MVAALRTLSIFGADQGGAYREHFGAVAQTLGEDVETRLNTGAAAWARSGVAGARFLTGNAGTGKTAVAEAYCRALGAALPGRDAPAEVAPGRWVVKDLSGLPGPEERLSAVRSAFKAHEAGGQALVCANEGVLRDAVEDLDADAPGFGGLLEKALRSGAAEVGGTVVVNVNRQRPTAEGLWRPLVHYVCREELWEPGCRDCPADGAGCPMRTNAAALRRDEVAETLRTLVRFGAGEAVPTMREVLAILAWTLVGGGSCGEVKDRARDRGREGFTAEDAYFARALGQGLRTEAAERSPLLMGMRRSGLGEMSDLEADEWLRDSSSAPAEVKALAGAPEAEEGGAPLAGTRSPLDRVATAVGTMTFHSLGETISTSEDIERVERCLEALVGRPPYDTPLQALWRQRLFFEQPGALGGRSEACSRLLEVRHLGDFLALAETVARGDDAVLELADIVKGLNFLVCGFSSSTEGLIVPDQACLFARDPGSYRPARPSLVHAQVRSSDLRLEGPDVGLISEIVDVDHLDVNLVALGQPALALRIRSGLYEAIREAAAFEGPVGQGTAEMTDVRGFYGRLAAALPAADTMRVADPSADPPSLVALSLPHFAR